MLSLENNLTRDINNMIDSIMAANDSMIEEDLLNSNKDSVANDIATSENPLNIAISNNTIIRNKKLTTNTITSLLQLETYFFIKVIIIYKLYYIFIMFYTLSNILY